MQREATKEEEMVGNDSHHHGLPVVAAMAVVVLFSPGLLVFFAVVRIPMRFAANA